MTDSLSSAVGPAYTGNVFRVNPSDRDSRGNSQGNFSHHYPEEDEDHEEGKPGQGTPPVPDDDAPGHESLSGTAHAERHDGVTLSAEARAALEARQRERGRLPEAAGSRSVTDSANTDRRGEMGHTDVLA